MLEQYLDIETLLVPVLPCVSSKTIRMTEMILVLLAYTLHKPYFILLLGLYR